MLELEKEVVDVPWHAEATPFTSIIPFDGDAGKFVSSNIELDPVVSLEKVQEEVEMFNADVFDTKVIHDEAELERPPFVMPKPRSGRCLIEAFSNKA
jgi:hypothetical protein